MSKVNIIIFALAAHGKGISGGDRIFIEFARRWSKEIPVTIYVTEEGFQMCRKQNLDSPVKFKVVTAVNYLVRIIEGIKIGLTLNLENSQKSIIYSASEFWMDSLPAFLLKLRFPKIKWAAAWYQTAPNPLKGFAEGKTRPRNRFRALVYWLAQLPIKPLISGFADIVLVNNDEEKKQFRKAVVVLGAVDLEGTRFWGLKFKKLPKIYDAVFQGRFHPQKGVLELIDIWKLVVDEKPDAKLVMIGDGPLKKNVELRIKNLELSSNIILKGYLFDGEEKYKLFSQSKVVVHPAFFDSGGMASAEAMAFGLPCVGFNLRSYESYYPQGMIKVPVGNLERFAIEVLNLLSENKLYSKIAGEALSMINKNWSWENRARDTLNIMIK